MVDEKMFTETVGEIDYAILVSLNYLRDSDIRSIDEEIRALSNILQIRHIIIEKHFYQLVKNGSIISDGYESREESGNKYVLTQIGTDAMNEFETRNEEWVAIDNFIKTSIENKKEQKIKVYKIADKVLTVAAIVCILSIFYVAIYI